MERAFIIPIVIVVFVFIYWMITHNRFISLKNQIKQNFSGIDIQLKKRWDLIPQLVSVVKGYTKHESELFESIVKARNAAKSSSNSEHDRFKNESIISEKTPQLFALAESYPDLKANEQFLMLQRNLTEIESQISASRRSYNAAVLIYNNLVQSFPSSIIASNNNHQPAEFFSIESQERNNVSIS
jgi:LemA protein